MEEQKDLLQIGINFRGGIYSSHTWDSLNMEYGKPFKNGEAWRNWVRRQLKKQGLLPKREDIQVEQADTKLNKIKEIIGEQSILKTQIRQEKTQLAKIQKDFIKSISIAEEIKQYISDNCKITIPKYHYKPVINKSQYEMLLHITDFHIGYVIDNCKGNYYNWEIANQRINKLVDECIKYIKMYNIKKVYVVNTGDVIEHISMRKNQSQFCEFNQSEQICKATEIIYRLLCALCDAEVNVEYDSIYGNHDRMNGDKTANLDGDNAEVIIRDMLGKFNEISKSKRLQIVNRRHSDKEIRKTINGIRCKFIHGENSSSDGKKAIKSEISADNDFFDILYKGHLHNFNIQSENHGRYVVHTGCLSGFNDYSSTFGCTSYASQTITIFDQNKIELIKDVVLQ